MEQHATIRVVTLKDLWSIFIQRFWIMALAAIVTVGGVFLIIQLTYVPKYESTATLYILRQDQGNMMNANYSSDDFSLALKVVGDCDYLLKSHSVLDEVIDELNLKITYGELSKSVSTSNPDSTRILEVTVVSDTPELAKQIVDSVCRVGTEKISEAMGFNQVNLFEYGVLNRTPCNKTGRMTYMLVGMIAALLVYAVFLIAFLLDDRIRTENDIEQYLGLSILGSIPNADEVQKGHYGYSSAYQNRMVQKGKEK